MPSKQPTDSLPSSSALHNALSHPLVTSSADPVTLSSILPSRKTQRVLVIFIRNFLCSNCQQFLVTLTQHLPPESLSEDLSIVVIGCGAPSLVKSYVEITQCPYPIYTDPSNKLYEILGMHKSLSLGSRSPEYIQRSLVVGAWKSVVQGLKRIPTGDVWGAGDMSVNGGEFLFVRDDVLSGETLSELRDAKGVVEAGWRVSWCHRMRNTRDHTEVDDLKIVLGLGSPNDTGDVLNEKVPEPETMMRRTMTSKMHRAMSKRSQRWVHSLTRSHTLHSGGQDSRPKARRLHSHSASVQVVTAS